MSKIVVVGANSYIARNLIAVVNKEITDCELKLYDCGSVHKDGAINYESIDILDKNSVSKIDLDCDIVFMFVGKTGSADGFQNYDTFIDINEKALLNLLNEYNRQKSEARIIFPSTRLVYKGKQGLLDECSEKEFKTVYAINKYACEKYLEQFSNVYGVKYTVFRICIPYGTLIPGASSYGTAEFMMKKAQNGENISLYGDGSVRRTLTYIEDLCNAMLKGAFCKKCENDIFNIGGEDYSLRQMAELIAAKYNAGIDYVDWPKLAYKIESGDTVFCDNKLKSICNVEYKMTFLHWCKKFDSCK